MNAVHCQDGNYSHCHLCDEPVTFEAKHPVFMLLKDAEESSHEDQQAVNDAFHELKILFGSVDPPEGTF